MHPPPPPSERVCVGVDRSSWNVGAISQREHLVWTPLRGSVFGGLHRLTMGAVGPPASGDTDGTTGLWRESLGWTVLFGHFRSSAPVTASLYIVYTSVLQCRSGAFSTFSSSVEISPDGHRAGDGPARVTSSGSSLKNRRWQASRLGRNRSRQRDTLAPQFSSRAQGTLTAK